MRLYLTIDRWYCVALSRDLFGEIVIVCQYGGRHNHIRHTRTLPFSRNALRQIIRDRIAHGYCRQPLLPKIRIAIQAEPQHEAHDQTA